MGQGQLTTKIVLLIKSWTSSKPTRTLVLIPPSLALRLVPSTHWWATPRSSHTWGTRLIHARGATIRPTGTWGSATWWSTAAVSWLCLFDLHLLVELQLHFKICITKCLLVIYESNIFCMKLALSTGSVLLDACIRSKTVSNLEVNSQMHPKLVEFSFFLSFYSFLRGKMTKVAFHFPFLDVINWLFQANHTLGHNHSLGIWQNKMHHSTLNGAQHSDINLKKGWVLKYALLLPNYFKKKKKNHVSMKYYSVINQVSINHVQTVQNIGWHPFFFFFFFFFVCFLFVCLFFFCFPIFCFHSFSPPFNGCKISQ